MIKVCGSPVLGRQGSTILGTSFALIDQSSVRSIDWTILGTSFALIDQNATHARMHVRRHTLRHT